MAKIFTITEGLENLGALKSGGQGSVYKARRTGEIITAIKILPTPIYSESEDDKHFTSFQNEVQKLKRVNEIPNPNVVSIIASGITSSGNLPYIEMEYIEGPDLGELLKAPYDPIFSIKETIKVADQLANALAHCHRANIKHGDIKSNNVKFNQRTGNYILLDFGLSVMSDEQRRTSIRYAGAIEFMAPEQSAGETLFETDIYSFGIILFELLAGTVPFPLTNKGEMARNAVMVAHLETLPPDIISLRRQALPGLWSYDKQEREMQVPLWLMGMIYKCLEKNPAKRFKNGIEVQEYIHSGIVSEETKKVAPVAAVIHSTDQDDALWKHEMLQLQLKLADKDERIHDLEYQVEVKDKELYQARYAENNYASTPRGVSKPLFFVVLMIAVGLAVFAGYDAFYSAASNNKTTVVSPVEKKLNEPSPDSLATPVIKSIKKTGKFKKKIISPVKNEVVADSKKLPVDKDSTLQQKLANTGSAYKIVTTAYFYNSPDTTTRSKFYLTTGNAILNALNEQNNFIYVVFTSTAGKITRGWLLKKNLLQLNEY